MDIKFQIYFDYKTIPSIQWWYITLMPAFERQRQVYFYEFQASMFYRSTSRIARIVTQRKPVSITKKSNF